LPVATSVKVTNPVSPKAGTYVGVRVVAFNRLRVQFFVQVVESEFWAFAIETVNGFPWHDDASRPAVALTAGTIVKVVVL